MRNILFLTAFVLSHFISAGAVAQTIGIATSSPGSLFHNIGAAIAGAANKAGINATVQTATSPNQYIPFVAAGGVDFGIANLQEVNNAYEGKAWFAKQPQSALRVVAILMPLREAIFVRADSEIHSIADLKGKPMVDGYAAQSTIIPQLEAMYATAGLTRADMEPVSVANIVEGANAFIAGESVGFIFAHGAGKVREAHAAVGGLRALPIPDTTDNLNAMRKHWPAAFLTEIEPGNATPGVDEPNTFMAYPQVIFTHQNASPEAVYNMARLLFDHKEELADIFPLFNLFVPKDMPIDPAPSSFHPDAIRFFKDVGIWPE
ncbi:MAG: TAXI family TRAP transporter solute-binding subunit [Hyphomicrobiales bacterium]